MKNEYRTAIIRKKTKENSRVTTFVLDTSVSALPGQYVMVWIPGVNEKPFGVVRPDPLTLSIADVGPFTDALTALGVGEKLSFRGPYGSAYRLRGTRHLLVGGGYGVVPLYFLAYSQPPSIRQQMVMVMGARTAGELLFPEAFTGLGVRTEIATDDGSEGFHGYSTDRALEVLTTEDFDSVYTCGPEIMMRKIVDYCLPKDIPVQVSLERHFKCGGMGLCGACSYHGHLVCTEGPVFDGSIMV